MILGCMPDIQASQESTMESPQIMKITIKKGIMPLCIINKSLFMFRGIGYWSSCSQWFSFVEINLPVPTTYALTRK